MKLHLRDIPTRYIEGVRAVAQDYDAFLLDIWGVLHDGAKLYDGVCDCLKHLKDADKKIVLLSNSARLAQEIEKQLISLGILPQMYDHILSSGVLARDLFSTGRDRQTAHLGPNYYLLGSPKYGLTDGLALKRTDDLNQADFLLAIGVTGNPSSTREGEGLLQQAALKGLLMVCANPDVKVMRDGVMGIGAGALAARYRELGGQVIYYGKPGKAIYQRCLEILANIDPGRIVAIGDSLETDIAGANSSGLDNILLASGVHAEDLKQIPENSGGMETLLKNQGHFPTMIARGFFW